MEESRFLGRRICGESCNRCVGSIQPEQVSKEAENYSFLPSTDEEDGRNIMKRKDEHDEAEDDDADDDFGDDDDGGDDDGGGDDDDGDDDDDGGGDDADNDNDGDDNDDA